jgi:hypothetical protein
MTCRGTWTLAVSLCLLLCQVGRADLEPGPSGENASATAVFCNSCNSCDACAPPRDGDPCGESRCGLFGRLFHDDEYGFYDACCCKDRLLGVFVPSDCRFSDFISPMTNPVYFEDPRNLTEARVIFLNHQIPGAVLGGGDVQLLATQLRAAITERLSIIATKDGYIFAGSDAPPINGWANANLGLKYNLYADPATQRLLSVGTRYEVPVGSYHALQGNTHTGQFDMFLTGGTQIGELSHFVSAAGFRLAADPNKQNDQFYWSAHWDRRLRNRPTYGLLEFNWYHWMTNVAGGPPFGGLISTILAPAAWLARISSPVPSA